MRFLHTADWQLGMTRHFLSEDAQARYTEARLQAIRRVGDLVREHDCGFVTVAGDVFESNQVDRALIARACDALATVGVPVLLLPGNHDPLDPASVFTSREFQARVPSNVTVLTGERPIRIGAMEVLGAPWRSKRPLVDLAAQAYAGLRPVPGVQRVLVAHGAVDTLSPNADDPALLNVAGLEAALAEGILDFVCLGDRHSLTDVGGSGRVWYSGTPEVTDFREVDPGRVLIVDLGVPSSLPSHGIVRPRPSVSAVQVGTWTFRRDQFDLNSDGDLAAFEQWLQALPDKPRTVMKLSLLGSLSLAQKVRLDDVLEREPDVLAALLLWERRSDLVVRPEAGDLDQLGLTGFASRAVEELSAAAVDETGPNPVAAQDALSLLYRLARSA